MVQYADIIDICTTCITVDDCIQSTQLRHPIWFCEAFDTQTDIPVKKNNKRSHPEEDDEYKETFTDKNDHSDFANKGLCSNCENRKSCMMPKPEGGVWHCEEYL